MQALAVLVFLVGPLFAQEAPAPTAKPRPNIVLILADDLGSAELGCYGQKKIRTPVLDALAAQGIRFTQAYAPSCVCAPTRGALLTGLHTGHAHVRDNRELGGWERGDPEGQEPLPKDTPTMARWLQARGYATCAVGKWGLGGPGTTGEPRRQGFDHWFGYLCQRIAHNYYPEHLWRNETKVPLEGNTWKNVKGALYAPDLMLAETIGWLRQNREKPFFLYYATPVPHAALQVPEESLADYVGQWDDPPYDGSKGYLPHPTPRAAYAAMVSRMDRDVGRILSELDALGVAENTIVIFASDNGATFNGGTDSAFFKSNAPLRGLKCSLYEGGIRTPLLVRWPGVVKARRTSDHVCTLWDLWATLADALGEEAPATDGVSFAPTLRGDGEQPEHESLYFEYHSYGGIRAARLGPWKAVQRDAKKKDAPIELYDLSQDPGETKDVAAEHPEVIDRVRQVFAARTPSPVANWNF